MNASSLPRPNVCRWQAIIFDLDDTLYPERQYVLSGMRAVAAWAQDTLGFSIETSFEELHRLFESGVRRNTFDRWLTAHGLQPADWVPAMVRVYRDHRPRIEMYPQTRELLERLGRGYRLGLITDGYLKVQERKVAALGLADVFKAPVFSDALGRDHWKPSPRPYLLALSKLGVSAARSVYVGDNPAKDFRGARGVGMASVRVRRPDGLHYCVEPTSIEDRADWEITTLAKLPNILAECQRTHHAGRDVHFPP